MHVYVCNDSIFSYFQKEKHLFKDNKHVMMQLDIHQITTSFVNLSLNDQVSYIAHSTIMNNSQSGVYL